MMESKGAQIERGIVVAARDSQYSVKSYTRPGIITPLMKSSVSGLEVGNQVYFFMFPDGDGLIIAKM